MRAKSWLVALGIMLVAGMAARAAEFPPLNPWPVASILGVPRAFTEDQALRAPESFRRLADAIWSGNIEEIPEPVRLAWQHFGVLTQPVGSALQVVGYDERAPGIMELVCQSLLVEIYEDRPWDEIAPLVGKSFAPSVLPRLKPGQRVRLLIYLPATVRRRGGNPLPPEEWIDPVNLGWVTTFAEVTTLRDQLRQPPKVFSGCPAFPVIEEWPVKKAGP